MDKFLNHSETKSKGDLIRIRAFLFLFFRFHLLRPSMVRCHLLQVRGQKLISSKIRTNLIVTFLFFKLKMKLLLVVKCSYNQQHHLFCGIPHDIPAKVSLFIGKIICSQ